MMLTCTNIVTVKDHINILVIPCSQKIQTYLKYYRLQLRIFVYLGLELTTSDGRFILEKKHNDLLMILQRVRLLFG
jgi:hypothetical protein